MSRPAPGQSIDLDVTSLAFGGQGVARVDGFVVFVTGAVPGDVVRATVTRVKKSYAEARIDEILLPSPDRCDAVCRHAGSCGGSRWQTLEYAVQLRYKAAQVDETLRRLGHLSHFALQPIKGMDDPWRYRNKVEFSIGAVDGEPTVGFHPPGRWDAVMGLDECLLLPSATESLRTTVQDWLRDARLAPWDPRSHVGFARHLTIREARGTGEILVSLATAPGELTGAADLVGRIRRAYPQVVGILHATNAGRAEVAGGLPYRTLWGRPHLYETLGPLRIKISIDAFYQTNSGMAEVLYGTVAEEAGLTGGEVVWDLYSGIGSIALFLSARTRGVLGIELHPAAVEDARENAALNGITSATFLQGDARVVLKELLEGRWGLPEDLRRPDVIILDPPRGGLAKKVVARTAALGPGRIVYVSCNPATMAPNAAQFEELGYRLVRVTPVDMFPHTPHIEAVGLLVPAA